MKFIKKLLIKILIIILIALLIFVGMGYGKYKKAITEMPLDIKVEKIRNKESFTKLEDLPKIYKDAVIAAEDHRFYRHCGIDVISIGRAIVNNIKQGKLAEGGSTITQQLIKNMYFEGERSLLRKVAEVFLTFDIEKNYEKDEILELYVNSIYYGDGYYTVKDACKGYFNKEVQDMNAYEATLLAGIPNAPSIYSLSNSPKLAHQRQKQVVYKMLENGYISQEEANDILEYKEKNK